MTEDAVQSHLDALSGEGLVACRRDGGKEFWSVASAQPEPARAETAGKKRGKAMAGPDDSFADLIDEPAHGFAAAPPPIPAPAPPPIKAAAPEIEEFEFAPAPAPAPAASAGTARGPGPAPEPPKEREPKRKQDGGPAGRPENIGERPKREQSAGPNDRFQEFAEKVPAKPKLPIELMVGAAILVLMLVLFIMSSSSGGKAKKAQIELYSVNMELKKLDSLNTEAGKEIDKLRSRTRALEKRVTNLEESRKAAASRQAAAADNKAKKSRGRQ